MSEIAIRKKSPTLNAAHHAAFKMLAERLTQLRYQSSPDAKPSGELLALSDALDGGLPLQCRNAYGENLLELCSRLCCEHACLDLMTRGLDPFESTSCVDQFGQFARLRPFEAFIAHDLSDAIEAVGKMHSLDRLTERQSEWIEIQQNTHAQLRMWRLGSSWAHLAAAAGARNALVALAELGISLMDKDQSGSGPLMACARSKRSPACATELMLRGADPWAVNHAGDCPAGSMPSDWAGLGAQAQAQLLRACLIPASDDAHGESKRTSKSI